ncbi:Mini-ribonuclease 3 [Aerococcus christensenii]|uniref:Mini-ribonuclease 3 n=2 Tax=Aerococcus christensenii TaxID=87541 RepID=A0A133Y321_9LACT|nr:RNase3 domain protein [Aerococcus christensenii]
MEVLTKMKNNQLSGLTLAYLGDAAWEIAVRRYLIESGLRRPNDLHQAATHFVSAYGQAQLAGALIEEGFFTETELTIFKRGRNSQSHSSAKHTDIHTYRVATGFEAVCGYLFLENLERFEELCTKGIDYLKEVHHAKQD